MNTRNFERRKMLRGAGVLGAGVVAGLAPRAAQARERDCTHGIEGTWLILVQPGGAPQSAAYEVLNLYTVGGGVAGASANDPATGSSAYGAWRKTENRQFQITFVAFTFDRVTGQTTGRLKVQARATLSDDDRTLSGPARVSIYSTSGSLIVQVPTAFSGTRIAVEPV